MGILILNYPKIIIAILIQTTSKMDKKMKAYCNGRIFTGEKFVKNACILVNNNKIVGIVDKNNVQGNA